MLGFDSKHIGRKNEGIAMTTGRINYTLTDYDAGVIAQATIHGDKSLNLVDSSILRSMTLDLTELLSVKELRCVFLSGCSEKAFIGGANLNALAALDQFTARDFIISIHEFCEIIQGAKVPIIGVLKGYCIGVGLEIAAACDFRIADHSVLCGMPEVKVGVPSVVEAVLLPDLVGWGKARELMLRGNIIDAKESLRIGLIEHLADGSDLDQLLHGIADDMLNVGAVAIARQKKLFREWKGDQHDIAIDLGVEAFVATYESDEPQRKIRDFFEK